MNSKNYDVIIVGTGAAGSVLAKELVSKNKQVLILEQGNFPKKKGTFKDGLQYYNSANKLKSPVKTKEGTIVYWGEVAGGSTLLACGNAVPSLLEELAKLGMPIQDEINEICKEVTINETSPSLCSEATNRMIETSGKLGLTMQKMPKFIDNIKCTRCGNCIWGCMYGAKWSADKLLNECMNIEYRARVSNVIIQNSMATGVEYVVNGSKKKAFAEKIILSAGGIGSPKILMNSGIEAGNNLSLDLYVNVYGQSETLTQANEPPMPVVSLDNLSKGFLIAPFIMQPFFVRLNEGGFKLAKIPAKKLVGLMVKIKDDSNGKINKDGSISKPITNDDQRKLNAGAELAKKILRNIGVADKKIVVSKIQGAHPAGTAAIGQIVNTNFETKIKNLYVCDASILPEAPGLPPILTIMALAKKLSKQLN